MPTKTLNYGLSKPSTTEYYDINVQNQNMDIIDKEMSKISSENKKRIDELEADMNDNQLKPFKTEVLNRLDNFVITDKVEPKDVQFNTFWIHDIGDTFMPSIDGVVISNASFDEDKGIKFEEIK